MGSELDLDDVVAGNPEAERELAALRAEMEDLVRRERMEQERATKAEESARLLARLALAATPERMGGTPDLFCPEGYCGSDPWGVWEQDVFAALPDTQEGEE